MKKASPTRDEMRAEYARQDLGRLVRGKYAARYAKATNVVVIDAALTNAFPNSEAVNEALRGLLAVATSAARLRRAKRPAAARDAATIEVTAATAGRASPRRQKTVSVRK